MSQKQSQHKHQALGLSAQELRKMAELAREQRSQQAEDLSQMLTDRFYALKRSQFQLRSVATN